VHRIGRTGRAGADGVALSFCDTAERSHLHAIQRLTKQILSVETQPADLPFAPAPAPSPADSRPKGRSGRSKRQFKHRRAAKAAGKR
jgi:ATP-dependent RNA helicase RhlE